VAEDGTVLPWDGEAVGELEARGPWVIRAYLDPDDDANHTRFHDGWLRTGDLGRIFPDGRVELVDRAKDLIKSGGEWISSIELEQALATHPAVGEAVVVGIPDAQWGERPAALVVPAPGRRVEPGELVDFLRGRVARWWLPDLVRVVDEIPKTPVGKYDKRRLRAELAEELERAPWARRTAPDLGGGLDPGAEHARAAREPGEEALALGRGELRQHLRLDLVHGAVRCGEGRGAALGQLRAQDTAVVRVGTPADEALRLEGGDDLAHRLRRDQRAASELGVGQAAARAQDGECRVLRRRQAVLAQGLVELTAQGALEASDEVGGPWLQSAGSLAHHLSGSLTWRRE